MNPRTVIDDLLEVTIAASFTQPGFRLRRRLFDWQAPPPDALRGRTALLTGPTSGLGRVVARELARLGARVVLVGRSEERLRQVRAELMAGSGEDRFPIVVADMASLASVRAAADQILATEDRLDVLIDNAGAMFPERRESRDGIEATLATLVVGPFMLIGRLLPTLLRSRTRVISVTSGGMYAARAHLDDLESRAGSYSGARAYARAKRVQVALVREWARRLAGTGVTVNAMHPGWADTPGLAEALPEFHRVMRPLLRTPGEGADTVLWLAADPAAAGHTGRLFLDRRARPFDRVPSTRLRARERRQLWDAIVERTGERDPLPG